MLEWFVEPSWSFADILAAMLWSLLRTGPSGQGTLRDGFGGLGGRAGRVDEPASRPASAKDPAEEELEEDIDALLEILSGQRCLAGVEEELAVDSSVSSNDWY